MHPPERHVPRLQWHVCLMVDLHCHILPAVDDGATSLNVALEMCRMAAEDGIRHIVATPHANSDYHYDRNVHLQNLELLRDACDSSIEFTLGCDFHFSYENVMRAIAHPDQYVIGQTKYLLIELSDYAIPPNMVANMKRLNNAGLELILTHPERNPILQRQPQQVLDWVRQGCLVQLTASSLTGFWGKRAKDVSRWLLEHRAVHFLASDAHDTHHRQPILSGARHLAEKWVGAQAASALVEENPSAILRGEDLPPSSQSLR